MGNRNLEIKQKIWKKSMTSYQNINNKSEYKVNTNKSEYKYKYKIRKSAIEKIKIVIKNS